MCVKVILSNKYLNLLFNSHENLHVCSGYYRETEQGQVRTGDLVKREGDRRGRRRTVGYGETFRLYPPETEVAFKDYRSLA